MTITDVAKGSRSVEAQAQTLPPHLVRRSEVYRAMKARLHAELDDLRAENARVRAAAVELLTQKDLASHPAFQRLREAHAEQKALVMELRAELRTVLPTGRAVYRTPEYRKLRADYRRLEEEVRRARGLRWAEEVRERLSERLRWALETLHILLPSELEPAVMARWHLNEAVLWAQTSGLSLYGLINVLQAMRREGLDPHMNHREVHGYVPAALRAKLLHDNAACAECESQKDLTIDHIRPLLHGGTSAAENLQVLCRSCNSKKGARLSAEAAA